MKLYGYNFLGQVVLTLKSQNPITSILALESFLFEISPVKGHEIKRLLIE